MYIYFPHLLFFCGQTDKAAGLPAAVVMSSLLRIDGRA